MRIDKFLWCIRFYKTRSVSAEEIAKNRVSIAESIVKPSKDVKEGDIISIKKNQIIYKIKVLQMPKNRMAAKLVPEYVQDITEKEQYDLLNLRKMQQDYYRNKGEGRPTKKDRRNIDEFFETESESFFEQDEWSVLFSKE